MNRRINTRVATLAVDGANVLIDQDASEVYWISCSPGALGTIGQIQIYDGFDAGGKLVWELHPGYARQYNFIPPIHCEMGVFVVMDAAMLCFTIAWRPKKWDRPTTKPLDVITP